MMNMCDLARASFICICCVIGSVTSETSTNALGYDYIYIDNYCNLSNPERILVGGNGQSLYGYMLVSNSTYYDEKMDCMVRLEAPTNHRITIRFQKIDTYQAPGSTKCSDSDTVGIIDAGESRYYCGHGLPRYSFYSATTWFQITFNSLAPRDYTGFIKYTGFHLYYTVYHENECDDKMEYECSLQDRCIPSVLKCDGRDNCGDWSDEHCSLSTVAIVTISIACVIVGVCLLATCSFCISYKKSPTNFTVREYARRRFTTRATSPSARTSERYPEPPPLYTYSNGAFPGGTPQPEVDSTYAELDSTCITPPSYAQCMLVKTADTVRPSTDTYNNIIPTTQQSAHDQSAV